MISALVNPNTYICFNITPHLLQEFSTWQEMKMNKNELFLIQNKNREELC